MKIRTDFVSNSSSSAFVVYRINGKHICSKKQLSDFIEEALPPQYRLSFTEGLWHMPWPSLAFDVANSMKHDSFDEVEKKEKELLETKTKGELVDMMLASFKRKYGDFLFDILVHGKSYYTVIDKNVFEKLGTKGYNLYKKFLSLESARMCCCNGFEDQVSPFNRHLNTIINGGDIFDTENHIADIRWYDQDFAKEIEKAYRKMKNLGEKKLEKIEDCYMYAETDYSVLFDENIIDCMKGFTEYSKHEIVDDIRFIAEHGTDKAKSLEEIGKKIDEMNASPYETESYSISRIGELIAKRFNVKLNPDDNDVAEPHQIVGGVHHMG